jgi:hypothetical protein
VNVELCQTIVSHFLQKRLARPLVPNIGAFYDFVDFEWLLAQRARDILSVIQHDQTHHRWAARRAQSRSGLFRRKDRGQIPARGWRSWRSPSHQIDLHSSGERKFLIRTDPQTGLSAKQRPPAETMHQITVAEDNPQSVPEFFHSPEVVHLPFREKVVLYREANILPALLTSAKEDKHSNSRQRVRQPCLTNRGRIVRSSIAFLMLASTFRSPESSVRRFQQQNSVKSIYWADNQSLDPIPCVHRIDPIDSWHPNYRFDDVVVTDHTVNEIT